MTLIEVRVHGVADPETELRSLLRWLTADEEVGPAVRGTLAGSEPARPDHLGTLIDLMSLVVSGALSGSQLALAIDQWRAHRRGAPKVTLRRGQLEIEVDGRDAETLRRVTELLENEERSGDGGTA
ncbi:effector-associated constant component EACC1 [Streptomyces griseochromogenes]|uniref:effector-associated constant component EACC1 n=1 Tax=Streptomyces griseochromogenes TaxID=68214 RepID=UPI0037B181CC